MRCFICRAQVNDQYEVHSLPLAENELRNGTSKMKENSSDSDEEEIRVFAGMYYRSQPSVV